MNSDKIKYTHEINFRYGWLSTILEALETGFVSVSDMQKDIPWFDGGWEMEYAESIYGIVFVSAQTYILGTTQDINKIRKITGKKALNKIVYYSDDCQPWCNQVSRIRLINSIANYYKHQDEWVEWPTNHTTKDLAEIGIVENTDFPCYEAALKLWQENDIGKLQNLSQIVSNWRTHILSQYR